MKKVRSLWFVVLLLLANGLSAVAGLLPGLKD